MRISESCAKCLYDRQKNKSDNEAYLSEIRELLDNRKETDTSPYMVYLFNEVILAKGQGNYESMSGQGWHVFYEFLCKCDLFTSRFNVPRLTGMFVEEILR